MKKWCVVCLGYPFSSSSAAQRPVEPKWVRTTDLEAKKVQLAHYLNLTFEST